VLKIAVCIKQIPLIEEANFDAVTKTIKRDGPAVISAYDLRAIALAVELKKIHGAETTVVTMGPPQARSALVDALAMGMDHAVHLEDRAFAGADTLATARALALWLARGKFEKATKASTRSRPRCPRSSRAPSASRSRSR
jgi:electron transfer flavoprotein alpha/beta subunit